MQNKSFMIVGYDAQQHILYDIKKHNPLDQSLFVFTSCVSSTFKTPLCPPNPDILSLCFFKPGL